ncbi:MAG: MFS transporter [Pseudonocardia sp.]|nr:MFS transporter [Pseudonocardia sp.]MBO0875403.1 MFS transporter [Pseudonocardia sp.]
MTPPGAAQARGAPTRRQLVPLYVAGFVTAFGAHSIAASLGGYTHAQHASLLTLGALLAVYDGAEVLLKPVFGSVADRIGPRPVLLAGLLGFAVASAGFAVAGDPALVGLARLGQGAAAAAFSPAASTLVARLVPPDQRGRGFGGYGAWKGLGYALGPLVGGVLITLGGYPVLFGVLALLAVTVAAAAAAFTPAVEPLPRTRQTLLDLTRQLTDNDFLRPTAALAGATAALFSGVGFLPALGAAHGVGPLLTGGAVSALAAVAALVQPWVGKAHDQARISTRAGMAGGLALAAAGLALAATLSVLDITLVGILAGALLIGAGTGLTTTLGFAHLAATTEAARTGQTMGAAEVGRELGDAGGPLLVGALATASTLGVGLAGLAALLAATAAAISTGRRTRPTT